MPWHRLRVYHDHSSRYRGRILLALDLSILVCTAVLIVAGVVALRPLFAAEGVTPEPSMLQTASEWAMFACAAYLTLAVLLRSKG